MISELDNPDNNITDTFEELKQRDDEKVFRHNKQIMQGLELKLKECIANDFVDQLDNIDAIKEKLDGLNILDELASIGDIVLDNIKGGNTPNAKNHKEILGTGEVNMINKENWVKENIPDEYVVILDNFKKGGKLVINGSDIYNAQAHQFNDPVLNNLYQADLIDVKLSGGSYKIKKKYDDMASWSKKNPEKYENFIKSLYDKGIGGIYVYDPKEAKYKHNVNGEEVYVSNLPKGVRQAVDTAGKVGIAIDILDLTNAIESGDASEIGAVFGLVGGGIAGEWVAVQIATSVSPIPGDGIIVILAGVFGGAYGSRNGSNILEKIGEGLENEDLYWEFDYE